METRKIVIGAVVVLIGLPVVLVLIAAAWIHVLDRTNGAIVSSGRPRSYLLYVPPRYDRAKPTPLVISMHGAAEWPAQQMNLSRWNRLAESQGFIVVYPTRIHANGVSNGGGMAFVLSCTLSDRIAAVGMVAAAQSLPWSWCTDRRPVPMIAFHGTADPIAPYSGGRSPVPPGDLFPNVPTWTAN